MGCLGTLGTVILVYYFEALCCLACGLGRVLGISVIPSLLTKNRRGIADLTTESALQLRVFSAETWQMLFWIENLEFGEHTIYSEWWLEHYFHFELAFLQELCWFWSTEGKLIWF